MYSLLFAFEHSEVGVIRECTQVRWNNVNLVSCDILLFSFLKKKKKSSTNPSKEYALRINRFHVKLIQMDWIVGLKLFKGDALTNLLNLDALEHSSCTNKLCLGLTARIQVEVVFAKQSKWGSFWITKLSNNTRAIYVFLEGDLSFLLPPLLFIFLFVGVISFWSKLKLF